MRLAIRFFKFIWWWIWRILGAGLKLLPYVFRAVVFAAMTFMVAVASLWNGVPNTCRENAERWQTWALQNGLEGIFDRLIYYVVLWATFFTILFCWVIFSYTTVWIIEIVGRLTGL